jgi:hypothetical protein
MGSQFPRLVIFEVPLFLGFGQIKKIIGHLLLSKREFQIDDT